MLSMEILLWAGVGGLLGWMGYLFFGFNEARGLLASMAIAAIGALIGAKGLAPMFVNSGAPLDGFNVPFLLFAVGTATACLALDTLVYRRRKL